MHDLNTIHKRELNEQRKETLATLDTVAIDFLDRMAAMEQERKHQIFLESTGRAPKAILRRIKVTKF